MNIKELHSKLQEYGINESEYHLHGLYGSTNDRDKIALNISKGPRGVQYEVYYRERSEKHSSHLFNSEADACQYIYDRLTQTNNDRSTAK